MIFNLTIECKTEKNQKSFDLKEHTITQLCSGCSTMAISMYSIYIVYQQQYMWDCLVEKVGCHDVQPSLRGGLFHDPNPFNSKTKKNPQKNQQKVSNWQMVSFIDNYFPRWELATLCGVDILGSIYIIIHLMRRTFILGSSQMKKSTSHKEKELIG